MPEMDGFEALSIMNKENLCKDCKKIILSNKSEQKDIEQGEKLGVAGYIVKANSTPSEVINQVVKILEKKIFIPGKN
jgi:DNA-binding NarL/FixJ family response regulator